MAKFCLNMRDEMLIIDLDKVAFFKQMVITQS